MWYIFFLLSRAIQIDSNFFVDSLNQTENIITQTKSGSAPTFGLMILMLLGMLLILSGVLYFSLYLIRKFNKKLKYPNENLSFNLYDTLYLGNKQGLSLIMFNDTAYIIGFSNNMINLIDKITDEETIQSLKQQKITKQDFKNVFKKIINKDTLNEFKK